MVGGSFPLKGPRAEISFGAEGYPEAFCLLADPPACLYVVGEISALVEGLAVIGARKATPYGQTAAKTFASMAARRGVTVISGGARGCDAAAHRAAIDAGGRTVAFLGGGCDRLYPRENERLFQDIVDSGGAVVSEQPWDTVPRPYMFRLRNRLIAGLARATLIVEAGLPSGTFSTADEAIAANREVLVVPGSILSPTSRGSNRLLLEGAVPVVDEESFEGQLSALFPLAVPLGTQMALVDGAHGLVPSCTAGAERNPIGAGVLHPLAGLSEGEQALAAMLRADPMRLEQLASAVSLRLGSDAFDMGRLMGSVAKLEGAGVICRYPDGRFGAVV